MPSERLRSVAERFTATDEYRALAACESIVICVPTPLANHREPDLGYLVDAATQLSRVQNVNVTQTIMQRLLGIGDVDWDTAGTDASDADFTFRGVDDPSALVHAADRYYGVAAVHETAQRDVQ